MEGLRTVLGLIKKADDDYDLIADNDAIAVGLSGGKDSLVLTYALNLYKKFSRKNYRLVAIYLDLGFPESKPNELRAFCRDIGVEFHVRRAKPNVYEILKNNKENNGLLSCSVCAKMKKAAMNKAAKYYGCQKVAFAHHADDAIETLFMNMTRGGRIATFEPIMHLTKENIVFIRPLIYCEERLIKKTALDLRLPIVKSPCPNDGKTEREKMKNFLKEYYKTYPESRDNFLTMLSNVDKLNLWRKKYVSDRDWALKSRDFTSDFYRRVVKKGVVVKRGQRGKLIAALAYTIIDDELIIDSLFVIEKFRRRKIATQLLREAEKLPIKYLTAKVYAYETPDFFFANGFKKLKSIKNIYYLYKEI